MAQAAALTIAGSDPSGGAGIQADLKTFHQHQVYGEAVITLLTVQNTRGVSQVETIPPRLVLDQLRAVFDDIQPAAFKTGALGNEAIIRSLAEEIRGCSAQFVLDPVMVSKHGMPLIEEEAVAALKNTLLPLATVVTPNIPEAEALTQLRYQDSQSVLDMAQAIAALGPQHVLIKGGHRSGDATDILWSDGEVYTLNGKRHQTQNTHGTGCTFSAAITANLARGLSVRQAASNAKAYIDRAIETNPNLGSGVGPVNFFADCTSC